MNAGWRNHTTLLAPLPEIAYSVPFGVIPLAPSTPHSDDGRS